MEVSSKRLQDGKPRLRLSERARVPLRLDHVVSRIVNANHSVMWTEPNERHFATGEDRRWISASGLQRRSGRTRGSLPASSARESGTSRTRSPYGPRLALH